MSAEHGVATRRESYRSGLGPIGLSSTVTASWRSLPTHHASSTIEQVVAGLPEDGASQKVQRSAVAGGEVAPGQFDTGNLNDR